MEITVDWYELFLGLCFIIPGFVILWAGVGPSCAVGAVLVGLGFSIRRGNIRK